MPRIISRKLTCGALPALHSSYYFNDGDATEVYSGFKTNRNNVKTALDGLVYSSIKAGGTNHPAAFAHARAIFEGENCLHILAVNRHETELCELLALAQATLTPRGFRRLCMTQATTTT